MRLSLIFLEKRFESLNSMERELVSILSSGVRELLSDVFNGKWKMWWQMRRKQRWRRQNTVVGKNPESWVTNFCKYGLSSRSDRWRFCAQSGDACFRVSREDVLIFRLYSSSTPGDSKSTLCPSQMSWIVGPVSLSYNFLSNLIHHIYWIFMRKTHSCSTSIIFPGIAGLLATAHYPLRSRSDVPAPQCILSTRVCHRHYSFARKDRSNIDVDIGVAWQFWSSMSEVLQRIGSSWTAQPRLVLDLIKVCRDWGELAAIDALKPQLSS